MYTITYSHLTESVK